MSSEPVTRTEAPDMARKHLTALAVILRRRNWRADLVEIVGLQLRVVNPEEPVAHEMIKCVRAADGSWRFVWPWRDPIAPVTHLSRAADIIVDTLNAVPEVSGDAS